MSEGIVWDEFGWHVIERLAYLGVGVAAGMVVLGLLFYPAISRHIFPALDTAITIALSKNPSPAKVDLAKGIFLSVSIRIAAVIFMITMFALYL